MTFMESPEKHAVESTDNPQIELNPGEMAAYVRPFIDRADEFIGVLQGRQSPLYVVEESILIDRAKRFTAAFRESIGNARVFYALKSNSNPLVASCLVDCGLGLDVSGSPELEAAVALDCPDIIFTGPGKTDAELRLAVAHRDRVILIMDSFGELERLEHVASEQGVRMMAGVRLTTQEDGIWRKFGIPLARLAEFFERADRCPHIYLTGIQFHTSWNLSPAPQANFITRLGRALRDLPGRHRMAIEFIDIGGGYWPPQGEWTRSALHPCRQPSTPIEHFARVIGSALKANIFPHVSCCIYAEPGRWLCNDAMHILLTVVDQKDEDLVITDAGTHLIGWERYETDYCPVINLSRPAVTERECLIFGSLCTPHDIWGFGYFGTGIEPGDILLIPDQGAYTYSLRQTFIKPPADTVLLQCEAPV